MFTMFPPWGLCSAEEEMDIIDVSFFLSFRCESGEEDGEEEYFLTGKPLFFFFFFFLFLLLTLECC